MGKYHILVNDIPKDGKRIVVDDQDIWSEPLNEFHVECQIINPISAKFELLPMSGGVMVRGVLVGDVELPCNRCAEPMQVNVQANIERFEASPDMALGYADDTEEDFDAEIISHIRIENATPILDLAELCWEEFMLAFPLHPICAKDCQGLCAVCGTNLNDNTCLCKQEGGDARLAILRSLNLKTS